MAEELLRSKKRFKRGFGRLGVKPREVSLVVVFASLTSIGAMLSLPIGPVPITLQTFFVYLAGGLLGPKLAFLSQLVYLLIGAAGLPVFSGFKSGVSALAGPTAGYLISFPLCALVSGMAKGKGFLRAILYYSLGTSLVYLSGVLWLSAFIGYQNALGLGLLPFIPGDVAKILMAAYIGSKKSVRKALALRLAT